LKQICAEDGITSIVSLHQLEYAKRFADRIIGLAQAQVVFDAAPEELDHKQLTLIYQQSDNPKQKDKYNADTQSNFSYQHLPLKTATQL